MSPIEFVPPILDFLERAREPVLVHEGARPFALTAERLSLEPKDGWLVLHVWDDDRSAVFRLTRLAEQSRRRLRFEAKGLFGREQRVELADRAARADRLTDRQAGRQQAREQLRASLARRFAGWTLRELTTGADLEHSLSPAYPRALVAKGRSAWAAMLAPAGHEAEGVLTFGLIWLDYLRRREPKLAVEGLALFLPEGRHWNTALRLKHLDERLFQTLLCVYDEQGYEDPVDLRDRGNIRAALERPWQEAAPVAPAKPKPEQILERQVRAALAEVVPGLAGPVYGQVPAFAATDRDLLDLLACDREGRLAVIELKAGEDIHLPLQALDYWLRVAWHVERGDFPARGYFPGQALVNRPPRLYFVAPCLEFHPSNDTVLRYFSPEVETERIGVSQDWRRSLRVVHRQRVGGPAAFSTRNDQDPRSGPTGRPQSQSARST